MKVVFLDIDGVLNSLAFQRSRPRVDSLAELTFEQRAARAFDPAAVELLGELLESTGASLVLSSTWRLAYGSPFVEQLLAASGLPVRFVGATPASPPCRGTEIAMWLHEHADAVESVAILDDDDDTQALTPWLVLTTFELGLQREHVELAAALLGRGRQQALWQAVDVQRAKSPALPRG